ncbi:MAG: hypothetical protein ACREDU_01940 [Methylocella sp.]
MKAKRDIAIVRAAVGRSIVDTISSGREGRIVLRGSYRPTGGTADEFRLRVQAALDAAEIDYEIFRTGSDKRLACWFLVIRLLEPDGAGVYEQRSHPDPDGRDFDNLGESPDY